MQLQGRSNRPGGTRGASADERCCNGAHTGACDILPPAEMCVSGRSKGGAQACGWPAQHRNSRRMTATRAPPRTGLALASTHTLPNCLCRMLLPPTIKPASSSASRRQRLESATRPPRALPSRATSCWWRRRRSAAVLPLPGRGTMAQPRALNAYVQSQMNVCQLQFKHGGSVMSGPAVGLSSVARYSAGKRCRQQKE